MTYELLRAARAYVLAHREAETLLPDEPARDRYIDGGHRIVEAIRAGAADVEAIRKLLGEAVEELWHCERVFTELDKGGSHRRDLIARIEAVSEYLNDPDPPQIVNTPEAGSVSTLKNSC